MNKFVIVDGLPYLLSDGKTFACRFDEEGFTVGAEVKLASVPAAWHSEVSVMAQCAGNLDSISAKQDPDETKTEGGNSEDDQTDGSNPDETKTEDEQPEGEKPLEELKLDELKEYAKEHGIDLKGARTKDTIIEAINASAESVGDPE